MSITELRYIRQTLRNLRNKAATTSQTARLDCVRDEARGREKAYTKALALLPKTGRVKIALDTESGFGVD